MAVALIFWWNDSISDVLLQKNIMPILAELEMKNVTWFSVVNYFSEKLN
jgi:hypothetical protein